MDPTPPSDGPKTIGVGGHRVWLYPHWLRGRKLTWRSIVHALLTVFLFVGPWIDLGDYPAIYIDIPGRRIHFWGLHLFATDGSYLLFGFGLLVFAIFLVTAVFGRVWCGWACPQTVFLESIIRPIERLIEGSAHQRRQLDAASWTPRKLAKKLTKYAAYVVVAGSIGTTFTAYFLGRNGTIEAQLHPTLHPAGTITFVFITALLLFDFAWFREQVCLVVCPYGRFQSVLLDRHSLTVLYDEKRGEPRAKKSVTGAGDCVDCTKCVQVCPTGVDIRRGTTMECVQCMACIDACDDIMQRLGRKPGLIRMSSEAALAGRKTSWIRPRVVVYAIGLAAVLVAFGITVANRKDIELYLGRQGGLPYVTMLDGRVQNTVRLRVSNKSDRTRTFRIDPVAPADLQAVTTANPFTVRAGEVTHVPVFLIRSIPVTATASIRVTANESFQQDLEVPFLAPEEP